MQVISASPFTATAEFMDEISILGFWVSVFVVQNHHFLVVALVRQALASPAQSSSQKEAEHLQKRCTIGKVGDELPLS